jgi:hypothetical protein
MSIQARSVAAENAPFAPATRFFEDLKTRLGGKTALAMDHADAERLLQQEGNELLRLLYQGWLDQRAPGEAAAPVVGAEGVCRPHARLLDRGLKTVFGRVTVTRTGYSAHDAENLFPRDAELNLPPDLYSYGVRRRTVDEVIKTSFDQAAAALSKTTGTTVPKRQLEGLADRAAVDFEPFYEARSLAAAGNRDKAAGILVLTTDAKGIRTRLQDLREATRKVAEERAHKKSKRLSPGEKRGYKRMAQLAAVYTILPFIRQPEDVTAELGPVRLVENEAERPRPEHKRVWASLEKEPEEVIDEMFQEALARDPMKTKTWVVLVDGNRVQLSLVKAAAKKYGVHVTIVVDLIHVLEYLWKASYDLLGRDDPGTERWVTERLLEILRGHSSDVAAGMRRSATLKHLPAKQRSAVDDCADYLLKYKAHLRYDKALAAGWPIATGVIEGACRHLVNDRMAITGASWSLQGAEAVLKLRSLMASGDLDEYWAFHEQAEWRRNHAERYRNTPPATVPPLKPALRRHLHPVN